jgi:ubiquinone/menaquinone biosynthesis C-methylase UbiE
MTLQRDPHGNETRFLHQVGRLSGARVLEVGCGEGRLTWRYAQATRSVVAIDPNLERLSTAPRDCPTELRERVHFVQADAERLALRRGEFDRAILAWSL